MNNCSRSILRCSHSIPHCKWIEGYDPIVYIQQSLQLLQLFSMRLERFVFLILLLNDLRLGLSLSILLSVAHIYSPRYLIECLP